MAAGALGAGFTSDLPELESEEPDSLVEAVVLDSELDLFASDLPESDLPESDLLALSGARESFL